MARSYQELTVWQRAMELVVAIYHLSKSFPKDETYGLTNQLRRASVSIPSNIAEGQARGPGNDFAYFLRIAQGSLQELETQILLSQRLGYLTDSQTNNLLQLSAETGRLNRGLLASLTSN